MSGIRIANAACVEDVRAAKDLILEYAATLPFDLGYQNFDDEIATFPAKYAPPAGRLLLARVDGAPAGCIAMRSLAESEGEVKRLYVRPVYRGLGLGWRLVEALLGEAGAAGYEVLRLDTIRGLMLGAEALYRAFGFVETAAYYDNPNADTVYYERYFRRSVAGLRKKRVAAPAGPG